MKITFERMAIAVLLVIIIVFIFRDCSRPSDDREAKKELEYKTAIAILEAEKKTGEAQFKDIVEKSTLRTQKDSLAIKRYNVEINILKKKVAISRARVDTIIRDNPELAVFVSQQDSIIIIQGQQIDTLKQSLALRHQAVEDLIQNQTAQARISQRIEAEKDLRIENLEKQNRRQRRNSKLAKIMIPIIGVAGFILGGL